MATPLIAHIVIIVSSLALLFFDVLHISQQVGNSLIISLLFIISLLLAVWYSGLFQSWFSQYGKWIVLFLSSFLAQLIVITLGGVKSPFFILLHLCVIEISFLFGSIIARTFFITSFLMLVFHIAYIIPARNEFLADPVTFLFLFASYGVMGLFSQVLSSLYHRNDTTLKLLNQQVSLDETVLQEVQEMVLVTDKNFRIVSVNEVVEQILQKSSSELLNQDLFTILFIKDEAGKMFNSDKRYTQKLFTEKEPVRFTNLLFLPLTGEASRKVNMKITPVVDISGQIEQLCFFVSDVSRKNTEIDEHHDLQEAWIKYQAQLEDIKKRLREQKLYDLHARFLLLTYREEDITISRSLQDHPVRAVNVLFDLATITKQIVLKELEYAKLFGVRFSYSYANFAKEDIQPLLASSKAELSLDSYTGPFFTITGDIKKIGIIIQELLHIGCMLTHTHPEPNIRVIMERGNKEQVYINIHIPSMPLTPTQQESIFQMYYPSLFTSTSSYLSSGLEGFIVKKLVEHLNIPLKMHYFAEKSELVFTLSFSRNIRTLS